MQVVPPLPLPSSWQLPVQQGVLSSVHVG